MQPVELFNYEGFTLKTVENLFHLLGVEKSAIFAVLTFVLLSHGKTEFPSRSSPLFLYTKAVQTSEMPNLFEHLATSVACFRT